jgi:hypothetical protein
VAGEKSERSAEIRPSLAPKRARSNVNHDIFVYGPFFGFGDNLEA